MVAAESLRLAVWRMLRWRVGGRLVGVFVFPTLVVIAIAWPLFILNGGLESTAASRYSNALIARDVELLREIVCNETFNELDDAGIVRSINEQSVALGGIVGAYNLRGADGFLSLNITSSDGSQRITRVPLAEEGGMSKPCPEPSVLFGN